MYSSYNYLFFHRLDLLFSSALFLAFYRWLKKSSAHGRLPGVKPVSGPRPGWMPDTNQRCSGIGLRPSVFPTNVHPRRVLQGKWICSFRNNRVDRVTVCARWACITAFSFFFSFFVFVSFFSQFFSQLLNSSIRQRSWSNFCLNEWHKEYIRLVGK